MTLEENLKNMNLRRIVFVGVAILLPLLAHSQLVTTSPAFPKADEDVTIIFDLKQAKDSRAAALLGKSSDVYLWAWGGSNPDSRNSEFGPTGQTSFNQPYDPGKMTSLGNDRWSIKLKPSQYLSVSAGKKLAWMGVLAKSGNGTAQTEDFTFLVYDTKLYVSFARPTEKSFFVEAGSSVPVKAQTSLKSTLTLSVDGVNTSTLTNADSLVVNVAAGNVGGVKKIVKITAQTTTETATEEFNFTVKPNPTIAALPAGIKDGINYQSNSKVTLSLFAPNKSFIYVVGDFNNWSLSDGYLMKKTPDGEHYWLEINNLNTGEEYAFQYIVDGTIAVGDPYSEKILDRNNDGFITSSSYPNLKTFPQKATGNIVSVLQTGQKPYDWKLNNFQKPPQDNLVIYELLVRDFVATQNYRTLADTLPYLKRLGVNCIELMPIMEFTGNDSWGYNPIYYTAPDKAYGTANDLKAFIDKCHQNGIAVILDMVLNQADYEFPYVKMYWTGSQPSKDSPMFNQTATHPFSVFFDFNHESKATQDLVDRIAEFWLKEYRFDGYRFDLSKGFTQQASGNDVNRWSAYDASRVKIWKRIYDKIRSYDPTAYVILEHFADDIEEKELAEYGMMFWGNQNGDFREVVKGNNANFQRLSYKSRGFTKPHLVGYMESHDEQRVMWDVLSNGTANSIYNTKTVANASNRIKAAAALMLLTPGPKMIWQFGELGYDVSIDDNGRTGRKPYKWNYLDDADRLRLYKVFAELNKLKLSQAAFRSLDFNLVSNNRFKWLTVNHTAMQAHVVGNFDTEDYLGTINLPKVGKWYDFFTGQEINFTSTDELALLKPGEFHVYTTVKLPTPEQGLTPWAAYTKFVITALPTAPDIHLRVYPNPTENTLRIELNNTSTGAVEILLHDLSGRTLAELQLEKQSQRIEHQLDIRQLPKGIYLLDVRQGDQRTVKKVVRL